MNLFFSDIREFFRKKSIYRVLFLVIVFFYAVFIIIGKTAKGKHISGEARLEERVLNETMLNAEAISKKIAEHSEGTLSVQILILVFAALFLIGTFFGFKAVRHFQRTGDFIPDSGYLSLVPWGIAEIFKVTILFFSAGLIFNVILGVFQFSFVKAEAEHMLLIHAAFIDLAAVWLIVYVIKKNGSNFRDLIGWRWAHIPWREMWLGIRTYVMIFPTFLALIVLLIALANVFSYEPPAHPLVHIFMKERALPTWLLGLSIFLACVIGPVVEEIFFRGFFYPALKRYFATGWAMTATAALFALVHENLFSFAPIFFLGFSLCYLYEKRSSVIAPIFLHITHNVIFLGYFLTVKSFLGASFFGF